MIKYSGGDRLLFRCRLSGVGGAKELLVSTEG